MKRRSTAHSAAMLAGGAGLSILANVGLTLYLASHLTPDDFGLFGIGLLVSQFGAMLCLQALEPATNRVVSLALAQSPESAHAFARYALRFALAVGTVFCLGVLAGAQPTARILFAKPEAAGVLQLMSPAVLGVALTAVSGGVGLGLGTARRKALLDQSLRPAVVLAAVVLAVQTGHGLRGAAIGYSLGQVIVGSVALFSFQKRIREGTRGPDFSQARWRREFARVGAMLALTAMVMFAASRADMVIVARLMPLHSVGVYSFVRQLLIPGVLAMGAIGQAIGMRVPQLEEERRFAELGTLLRRASFWTASIAVPVFGAVAVLGARFLQLVDGRYTISMVTVVVLAIGQALNATSGPVGRVLVLGGRPQYNLFNNATVACAGLLLSIALIPRMGILGAAIAAALCVVMQNTLMIGQVWILYRVAPFSREQLMPWLATAVGSVTVLAISALMATGFVPMLVLYAAVTGAMLLWLMPQSELTKARAYLSQQLVLAKDAR